MPIKTFRGILSNDQVDKLRIKHIDGKTGYRIVKFQLMGISENKDYETAVQIFSIEQDPATLSAEVDFSEHTLLAAGLYGDSTSGSVQSDQTIIFDKVIFNQDIYVCHKAASGSNSINYYLELEQIKLDDVEATAVILKNFRNTNTV